MIGNVDRYRLQRALRYLETVDDAHHRSFVCHTISLNSYVQLQLSRSEVSAYHILIKRACDGCVLLYNRVEQDMPEDKVLDVIESSLKDYGGKSKCHICNQVEIENGYCETCSVMMTTLPYLCSICIDESRKEAVWVRTECGHYYHHECLARVLDRKCSACSTCSTCSTCRKVLDGVKII